MGAGRQEAAMRGHFSVLLVEDNQLDAELVRNAFFETLKGASVRVATDGETALECLLGTDGHVKSASFPEPTIVLLDLKLPGISGFQVLEKIKSTPNLKRLPVVVFTSSNQDSDRAACYDLGANSYVVKPSSYEGFLEAAAKFIAYWSELNSAPPSEDRPTGRIDDA